MLVEFCHLILLFFTFSVLGWCMEVILKYRQYGRFINRGFLIGPYCPIYGSGIVFVTLMVRLIAGVESSVGTTFVISFIGCGALEYAVSYYLEKRFHARWWDYSTKPMNLHGRIWIGNLILFGIGGTVVTTLINPVLYRLYARIPLKTLYLLCIAIAVILITDNTVSHFVMRFVKSSVENSEADDTESISKEIRMLMSNKSILYKRISDAYPDVIYRTERINRRMNELKAEVERISKEANANLERVKEETESNVQRIRQEAGYNLELLRQSPFELRDEIIERQDQLIHALQETPEDKEQIRLLAEGLQEKKQLLDDRRKLLARNLVKNNEEIKES